ncbi:MAG: type III-B CRISPR module RAMP protein Cmr1 [Chloroflexota bacterium]
MTRIPKTTPPPVEVKKDEQSVTETRHYKLITPLYGGGVEPGRADPVSVARATEIRGHLRFWWRATRGGNPEFGGKLDKMKAAEDEIWGSSGGKGKPGSSRVDIEILDGNKGRVLDTVRIKSKKGVRSVSIGDPASPYGYVAFPLRKTDESPAGSVQEGVEFTIRITYKPRKGDDLILLKKEVETALWAWETFGGIGARTRRGFGAIQCISVENQPISATPPHEVEINIREKLKQYQGDWPEGVPHLSANLRFVITPAKTSSDQAWSTLFKALQNFRQKDARYDKKTGSQSDYGMSRWPEANAIRDIFSLPPQYPAGIPKKLIKKFPRAAFGLPIGFEMHHDKSIEERPELQGAKHDRLASPLILRPLACADDKAVGLAAVLEWEPVDSDEPYTPPGGLRLVGKDDKFDEPVQSRLNATEASKIPPLKGQTDVLQAFLDYLKGK